MARQKAELAHDRLAASAKAAEQKADEAVSELRELQSKSDTFAKTSRASHDPRAAIIATADSLAEEVVRADGPRRGADAARAAHAPARRRPSRLAQSAGRSCGRQWRCEQWARRWWIDAAYGGDHPAGGGRGGEFFYEAPEGASAVEKECGFAVAEIAQIRAHLERRRKRAQAATGKAGIPMPSVLAGQLASGRTNDERARRTARRCRAYASR